MREHTLNSFGRKILAAALGVETSIFWAFGVWPLAIFYAAFTLACAYISIGDD